MPLPSPPTEELQQQLDTACEARKRLLELKLQFVTQIEQIVDVINDVIELLVQIKWGKIPDNLGATLVTMANQVAGAIASNIIGSVSEALQKMLEGILAPLLKIIFAFPEAISALVRIPQDQAIRNAERERLYLNKARTNISIIIKLVEKWFGSAAATNYRARMQDASEAAGIAIEHFGEVITQLEADNAYFDQQEFNSGSFKLEEAIELSFVQLDNPVVNEIDKQYQRRVEAQYQQNVKGVNKTHRERSEKIKREFVERDLENETSKVALQQALDFEDSRHKVEKSYVRGKASVDVLGDRSMYEDAAANLETEFMYDLRQVKYHAGMFTQNIGKAYASYKECQLNVQSVYNFRTMIVGLLEFILSLIKNAGNTAGETTASAIQDASDKIEGVKQMYDDALAKEPPDVNSELASKLAAGYQVLTIAEMLASTGTTESMIKLINADEILSEQDEQMEELQDAIYHIPDWNGDIGVWGVGKLEQLLTFDVPYVMAIPKAAVMTTLMPAAMLSGDRERADKLINELYNVTESLINHNRQVTEAVETYIPDKHPMVKDLEEFLKKHMWLFKMFSMGFALKSIVSDIVDMAQGSIELEDCRTSQGESPRAEGQTKAEKSQKNGVPEDTKASSMKAREKYVDERNKLTDKKYNADHDISVNFKGQGDSPFLA